MVGVEIPEQAVSFIGLTAELPCSAACPIPMPPKATLFLGVFVGALCSAEPINFSRQIRPILSENCIA